MVMTHIMVIHTYDSYVIEVKTHKTHATHMGGSFFTFAPAHQNHALLHMGLKGQQGLACDDTESADILSDVYTIDRPEAPPRTPRHASTPCTPHASKNLWPVRGDGSPTPAHS
jgi:hypothetical protein